MSFLVVLLTLVFGQPEPIKADLVKGTTDVYEACISGNMYLTKNDDKVGFFPKYDSEGKIETCKK